MEEWVKGTDYTIDLGDLVVYVTRKRVKNVNFRIGKDGACHMSVPSAVSHERATMLALEYAPWFRRHRRAFEERRAREGHFGTPGETVWVWGEPLEFCVEKTDGVAALELRGSTVLLRAPDNLPREAYKTILDNWYSEQLHARLSKIRAECEGQVGKRATSITLRRMTSRWGSCTPRTGRIRLNVALAECPPECLRMVLTHELCHLWESNHGPRFKALMDLNCPDWRFWQRWLDEHPPRRV